jgi:PAS domain S-box-containing protein
MMNPHRKQTTEEWDFEAVIGKLFDDLIITDERGRILTVNGDFEKMYGQPSHQLVGKTVAELEKQRVFYPSVTLRVLETREKQTAVQQTKSGRRMLVTGLPVFDNNGQLRWVTCLSRDITEPVRLREHLAVLEKEVDRLQAELEVLRHDRMTNEPIVAASKAMQQVLATARKAAKVDVNVLLLGESGVGKTALARWIHQHSARAEGPLIEVNCGAIPEALLESELFGYEAGAFTGAQRKGKPGFAELADGGTLFFDEIAELSPASQVKVLKLIQEKRFYRVGGTEARASNFRLIAATNQDLEQLVKEGRFRQDLYYRLNVVPIVIPPLRERKEDIVLLIRSLMETICRKYGVHKTVDPQVVDWLTQLSWKGNVRELENLLERLVVTTESTVIRMDDMPEPYKQTGTLPALRWEKGRTLNVILNEVEREVLLSVAKKGRTTAQIASLLGVSQPTVVRKLKKHGIRLHG